MEEIEFINYIELCGVVTKCAQIQKIDASSLDTVYRVLVYAKDEIQATVIPVVLHIDETQQDSSIKLKKGDIVKISGSIRNLIYKVDEHSEEGVFENCILAKRLDILGYVNLAEKNEPSETQAQCSN